MKKTALGTNRAGEDVEIMNEPMSGIGQYQSKYDVEMNFKPVLPKRIKKKMKKTAALETAEADGEDGDSPFNLLNRPRKKNVPNDRPLESIGFTDHFFEAVNGRKGRKKMKKEAMNWRRTGRVALRNADNVMPFMGGFLETNKQKLRRKKEEKRKRKR